MGLVAYLTAGDPSLAATEQFVLALADAGADVIELGVPFSDPVADGPVIQRASERALRSGTTLAGVLSLVKSLRAKTEVPLVLFSYFNPVLQMGLEKFGDAAKAAGADGVLITDLTPEEAAEYRAAMSSRGLDTIFLAAPTSTDERLALIAKSIERISVPDFAHRRDRRERSARGRIAGPGAARAARSPSFPLPSASAFRCRGTFRCSADWPTPPWSVRRWWKRSSAPRPLKRRLRRWPRA